MYHGITKAMDHSERVAADIGAVGIGGAAFLGWLPTISAAVTIIWVCIRIYETKTVQNLIARVLGKPTPVIEENSNDDE